MAMASVFSSQSNDCTAIWYNPAGLVRAGKLDVSVDLGQEPSGATHFKYLGVVSQRSNSQIENNPTKLGYGFGYNRLYTVNIDVDSKGTELEDDPG